MSVFVPSLSTAKYSPTSGKRCCTKRKGRKPLLDLNASIFAERAITSTNPLVNSDVSQTLAAILIDLAQLRPLKEQLQKAVETALAQSTAKSLRGCRLEVVGSSSWHGDVPQSDLDLVLFTPEGCTLAHQAVEALKDLRRSLEEMSCLRGECDQDNGPLALQQMELVEMTRVPILRMQCQQGLHCDISVDQHHSVKHRDLLKQLLASQPVARDLVRLIKFWLRGRSLPGAPEGGVPSLAWAIIAVRFAQSRPRGSCIKELFCDFFAEMQKLNHHSLCLRRRPVQAKATPDSKAEETCLEWLPRGGSSTAWAEEWLELLSVEDPCTEPRDCLPKSTHFSSITSPSIPAALGLLYIVELRLAFSAIREGRWYDVWRRCPVQAAPSLESLMADSKMHVVMKDGWISIGKMQDVQFCKGLVSGHRVLNRRDQSSQLILQGCKLLKGSDGTVYAKGAANEASRVACEPCHWVCSLPVNSDMMIFPTGLMRLAEIVQAVGVTRVSSDLLDAVRPWIQVRAENQLPSVQCDASLREFAKPRKVNRLKNMPVLKHTAGGKLDIPGRTDSSKDLGDDSTRASTSDCESQSTYAGAPEMGVLRNQGAPAEQSASGKAVSIHSRPGGDRGNGSGLTSEPAAPRWADIRADNLDANAGSAHIEEDNFYDNDHVPAAAWHGSNDIGLVFEQAVCIGTDVVAQDLNGITAACSHGHDSWENNNLVAEDLNDIGTDCPHGQDSWESDATQWQNNDIAVDTVANSGNAALTETTSAASSSSSSGSQQRSESKTVCKVSAAWKPTLWHNLAEFRSNKLAPVAALGETHTS